MIFGLSLVVIILEVNSLNAAENALLIIFSLLKLALNGSDISIFSILKVLLLAFIVDERTNMKMYKHIIILDTILKFFF